MAGLASIGIHGLAFKFPVHLPNSVSGTSQPPASIEVVELTPEEKTRLPSTKELLASNSLPAAFYEPILPVPPKYSRLKPSISPESPSPQPKSLAKPNTSNFKPESDRQPTVTPSSPSPNQANATTFANSQISNEGEVIPIEILLSPSPSTQLDATPQPVTTPVETNLDTQSKPTPDRAENRVDITPKPISDSIIDVNENQPSSPNTSSANPDLLAFNPENTTEEAGDLNYQAWMVRAGTQSNEFKELVVDGNYPEAACVKKLSGEVKVAILIDKDRQPNDAEIVQSSGYQVFDEGAIADVMSNNFDNAAIGQVYLASVKYKFEKDKCNGEN